MTRSQGTLQRYVEDCLVAGLTSDPTIFDKAIGSGSDHDADLARHRAGGVSDEEVFFELAGGDLRRTADLFARVFPETLGV